MAPLLRVIPPVPCFGSVSMNGTCSENRKARNPDNVSDVGDMYTCGLLSKNPTQCVGLVKRVHRKVTCSWNDIAGKIARLEFSNNHSLTP